MVRKNERSTIAVLLLAGTAFLVLSQAGVSPAQEDKKSKSQTKVSAKATKPDADGKQVLTVTLDINPPWYAYANPVGQELLETSQTKVEISSKVKLEEVKIDYPPGKLKKDEVIGDHRVFEGKVEIKATVRRAKGDTGPLEVTVHYATCHPKGVCLPAEKVKVTVP